MPGFADRFDQGAYLSILTHAPTETVKAFVEELLPTIGEVEVLNNRTGLVMLPYTDSRQGALFHLGEVLIAEAHVRLEGAEGYAACVGRDHVQALAVAILDAALRAGLMTDRIWSFIEEQSQALEEADRALLRKVEATRVELETF
jgi:alpha-D-ribose 1-methylphosphonate 5-triphosphate synthase subunit PhnG